MHKPIKILIAFTFVALLIPIGGLLLLKVAPQSLLAISHKFHSYNINAETIDVALLTPSISINGLAVLNKQGETLLNSKILSLGSQWGSLVFGNKSAFANVENTTIEIEAITQSLATAKPNEKKKTAAREPLDIHDILTRLELSLSNIKLNMPNNIQTNITTLTSFSAPAKNQTGIDFDLNYQQGDINTPLKGQLVSTAAKDATPQLRLSFTELDIRGLTKIQNSNIETSDENTSEKITASATSVKSAPLTINTSEQPIDWAPLRQFSPLDFSLNIDKVLFAQGEAAALSANIKLTSESDALLIHYKQSGELDVALNEDFHFIGPLEINTQWQTLGNTTTGADIKGKTQITLADSSANIDGTFNLNGVVDQNITLDIVLEQFPLAAQSQSAKSMVQQSAVFLPFRAKSQIKTNNKSLSLSDLSLKAGESDLTGHLTLGLSQASALESIDFDFSSTQISLPESTKAPQKTEAKKTAKANKLFNDTPINSSLLDTISTKGQLNIDKINYGKRVLLEGLSSTLSLQDKTLSLNSQVEKLAEGKVESNMEIKHADEQLQLSAIGSVKDLLLESLALLPEDEFIGGKTDINFDLNSKGNSTKALASRLQGDFLLSSREGTIANNSFELIGSDLLLKLVNTINPFYKKAKNTQLECAVVKSSIKDGKMKFDDSIAIKTSKMIIIANGNINLAKERVNLGINPKARSGVGVDIASLAKFVAIKGPLTQPSVGVSAEGSLKSALQLGAAISTGGLSLIASGIADKAVSGDACKLAQNAFSK